MRSVCTMICAGVISFAGFAAYAQPPMSGSPFGGAEIPSITSDGTMGQTISEMMQEAAAQEPIEQTITIIDVPLIVDVAVPDVNLGTAETIDTKGRYAPRLRIDFAEFPLRSFAPAETAAVLAVASRIRHRLRLPNLELVIEDRTATVSGTVSAERQRTLVEIMLRFEPGIDAVQNRISVIP